MQEVITKNLNSTVREFNYFLSFLRVNKKISVEEIECFVTEEFLAYNRVRKILYLISCFFHDPLFISYIYLKIYLRRHDYEIKELLFINSDQLNKLRKKFLRKEFQIKLKVE